MSVQPLQTVSEIRRFFRTAKTPVYFVSATAFNLLGIDRWVPTFRYLNYYDSFDGYHPNVFVPRHHSPPNFASIEEICNYLLGHKETRDFIRRPWPGSGDPDGLRRLRADDVLRRHPRRLG